jgi:tetraacyldisaccharide 4'-kinase
VTALLDSTWLAPLGALYGSAAAARAWLYAHGVLPQARLAGPVISVGNLSSGGTGKTPVVAWLARLLQAAGFPVAILSRGYRGSFRGAALFVSDERSVLAGAAEAGDEPLMLARSLPGVVVAVGRQRDVVGRAVESRFGPRAHVLDDGFQHLRLYRDLDVVCLDETRPFDRPLPAGRAREWPSALRRADLLLVGGADASPSLDPQKTFRVRRHIDGFFARNGEPCPAPRRAFLLAGIARPARFEADVRSCVAELLGTAFYPDHHVFSLEDLRRELARARSLGADAVVTTAKDEVRLPVAAGEPPVLVARLSVEIDDALRFGERVLSSVRGRLAPSLPPS